MFSGDHSIRVSASPDEGKFYDRVEDELSQLGDAYVGKRGDIDIRPKAALAGALTRTVITGEIRRRKNGEYDVWVSYACVPTALVWILAVLFFPFGLAFLFAPMGKKDTVARYVRRAMDNIEDDFSDPKGK